MREIIGHHGRGQSNTLCHHLSSIQNLPATLLESFSGMVVGIHQLYGPKVKDLSNETVIMTVSKGKKQHHQYERSIKVTEKLLKKMGHATVLEMDPQRHDRFMALQQFLSHSYFLLIASALQQITEAQLLVNEWDELDQHMAMANRILSGNAHVYEGIAKSNIENGIIIEAINKLIEELPAEMSIADFIEKLQNWAKELLDDSFNDLNASRLEIKVIAKPVSRVRDVFLRGELSGNERVGKVMIKPKVVLGEYLKVK